MKDGLRGPGLNRRTVLAGAGGLVLGAGLLRPAAILNAATATEGAALAALPEIRAKDGLLDTTIEAGYGYYTLGDKPAALRSYNGGPAGPTLRLRAGDTLKLALANRLPPDCADCLPKPTAGTSPEAGEICKADSGDSGGTSPRSFNITNMHVHGVHVSPDAPADDITVQVNPGATYHYEYHIPKDHPPGTYFYHAHVHGSVALQVASGMAGALIIEGPLDDIPEIAAAREQVLVFQSQCLDADGRCEAFPTLNQRQDTYLNGQLRPTLSLRPGEVQRWRIVNASHDRFLLLRASGLTLRALAYDGNPLARPEATEVVPLSPGNRADILVQADAGGVYQLTTDSWPNWDYPTQGTVLASVSVAGGARPMKLYDGPLGLEHYPGLTPLTPDQATVGRRLTLGQIGNRPEFIFTIDDKPFPKNGSLEVKLGAIELWEVVNQTSDPHPFHIHVNPVQVLSGAIHAPPGRWLDTVVLPPAGKLRFLTRFADFTGTFVFHCHILTHEDLGMMRMITVKA
jgi:FtsP/CotA-like multicopper oxidase with cupredoxin domain